MKTSPFLDEIRTEGRNEGRNEKQVENIVRLLQVRLKLTPSAELVSRLRQTHDENRLAHWFDLAATVNTLEEFLAETAKG